MDQSFYVDTREPFQGAVSGAVSLSTTDVALYTPSAYPSLGGQYWARVGKMQHIHMFGAITTAATPGNLTFDVYYGSGANATGTIIASSAALTLVASQTNISWSLDLYIRCVTIGSAGTLICTGNFIVGTAVIAAGFALIPATAPAASSAVDLTAANIISVQAKRSGSTAETMSYADLRVYADN